MIDFGMAFFAGLSWAALFKMFWYYFLFEFPRYVLSTFAVSINTFLVRPVPAPRGTPISVLLVGLGDPEGLLRTIGSLEEQDCRIDDIVVVEDGGGDRMAAIAAEMQRDGRIATFVATGVRGGKSGALNLGFRYCRHDTIVVADIDTSFDRDAISLIVGRLLSDVRLGAVSGNIGVRNPDASVWTGFQTVEYMSNISLGRQFLAMVGILTIVSGAFGAFRRKAIIDVGGWEVGPGDDSNLTTKIRRAGWQIGFEPAAWTLTDVPETLSALWKQRLRWNRSLIRNRWRKFRGVFDARQENFRLIEAFAAANQLWFNFLQTLAYIVYVAYAAVSYGKWMFGVLIAFHVIVLVSDVVEFVQGCLLVPRRGQWRNWPYAVGGSLYVGLLMRFNRLQAYGGELLFRRSYEDSFYPSKVRDQQDQF
jgi:cellulose synthase/poly-beta-1,6-N-acetylglucosamine synthase-like glycosyltransferase